MLRSHFRTLRDRVLLYFFTVVTMYQMCQICMFTNIKFTHFCTCYSWWFYTLFVPVKNHVFGGCSPWNGSCAANWALAERSKCKHVKTCIAYSALILCQKHEKRASTGNFLSLFHCFWAIFTPFLVIFGLFLTFFSPFSWILPNTRFYAENAAPRVAACAGWGAPPREAQITAFLALFRYFSTG